MPLNLSTVPGVPDTGAQERKQSGETSLDLLFVCLFPRLLTHVSIKVAPFPCVDLRSIGNWGFQCDGFSANIYRHPLL